MKRPIKRAQAQRISLPAPIQGIVESQPAAAKGPLTAEWMENFLPTQRGLQVRGGTQEFADVTDPVKTLFTFKSGTLNKIYAATADTVYDITTTETSVVSSLTSGDWSAQQIGVSGGDYLVIVNGEDEGRIYDGTSWSSLSVTGVTTSDLSDVWLYRNRLFFIEKDSLKVWYLSAGSIAGTASDTTLAGIFRRGGSLLMGSTWSLDSGDGIDDKCVFISTQGEVAVYSGSDPSDATTWALEGRYDIGKPIGKRATMQAGGDLLVATVDGIVPISQAIQKDPAALSLAAVSRPIKATWSDEVRQSDEDVELHKWTKENLMLTVFPSSSRMLTANLQTGAWAFQTGWVGTCATIFQDEAYVGREDGKVIQINVGGFDLEDSFTARVCYSFSDLGDPTQYKAATMARGAFYADADFLAKYEVSVDYNVSFAAAPNISAVNTSDLIWGTGVWGTNTWARNVGDPRRGVVGLWSSVAATGYAIAPVVQISSGSSIKLPVELVAVDVLLEAGGRAS
ncbi:hypothetical protein ROJ8625_04093 [Roseivivax jejudonensis]|uniref:Uncharacterized protein n=1 Tax=Roseivivax jejudonensis TaxID=1529041 RepID=A0A1X7AAT5_9RHOB|nr:hypothetical protein [Roseivivax jejudonensis]SLN74743.1 hypothetical protein ROJ8625_04093 [Roseivivax jejudonensis]